MLTNIMKKQNSIDKKKLMIRGVILFLVGIISLILVIYFNFIKNNENPYNESNDITDALKFKQEYENLNGMTDTDGKNKYVQISIDDDNPIIYKTSKEIIDILSSDSGIIYFGYSECQWSRNAIPILLDAAKEKDINEIYYLDIKNIRNELVLEDDKITTINEGTKDYNQIVDILDEYLPEYDGLDDDSIKRIYTPTVVFVKDGDIELVHYGTVDEHTNALVSLDNNEKEDLKEIYIEGIEKIK